MRFLKFFNTVTHIRSQIVRFQSTKTVFALSSGHGTCGVAVIRLTGSNSGQALLQMTNQNKLPIARRAQLKKLIHPETKEILDHALTLWFPGQYCQILHSVEILKIYSHHFSTKFREINTFSSHMKITTKRSKIFCEINSLVKPLIWRIFLWEIEIFDKYRKFRQIGGL